MSILDPGPCLGPPVGTEGHTRYLLSLEAPSGAGSCPRAGAGAGSYAPARCRAIGLPGPPGPLRKTKRSAQTLRPTRALRRIEVQAGLPESVAD